MKNFQTLLLVAAVLLWRIAKTCAFEVSIIIALVLVKLFDVTVPTWAWFVLCLTSIPTILMVWTDSGRIYGVESVLAGKVRVTDIAISSMMMVMIAVAVLFTGPWWAAVVLWVEAAHHGAMAALTANALNEREDAP